MIVAETKPLYEIVSSISRFKNILVVGCGSCVTVCLTGGNKAAEDLVRELSLPYRYKGDPPLFRIASLIRQCEKDLVEENLEIPQSIDAILSLACGAGVQTVSEAYPHLPVIPALNTTFLGAVDEPGIWREKCRGCGDCILAETAGICPVTRCAKQLFNGPCGGAKNGMCEIRNDVPCAWNLIIERLIALDMMENLSRIIPPRDWSRDRSGGPRELVPVIE
ncbi:MAG: methylenetetrahydrofolate reductase C-terminal domain-containing protein [Desulfatiglandaceae bacterium]